MPTIQTSTKFEVYCDRHSTNGVKLDVEVSSRKGELVLIVEPCQDCLEEAEGNGYERGLEDGQKEG